MRARPAHGAYAILEHRLPDGAPYAYADPPWTPPAALGVALFAKQGVMREAFTNWWTKKAVNTDRVA